jgi:hypothetical protein
MLSFVLDMPSEVLYAVDFLQKMIVSPQKEV